MLRPFHWNELTKPSPDDRIGEGAARQRKPVITKWSAIDRYRGDGAVAKILDWGAGRLDADTATLLGGVPMTATM